MTISMNPRDLIGHEVFDPEGERIGEVESVYIGEQSQEPEWVTVRTGLFGQRESFVPLTGAHTAADGLQVGVPKSLVKNAPHIESRHTLSETEGMDLCRHYGMPMQRGSTGPVPRPGGQQPTPQGAMTGQPPGGPADPTMGDRGDDRRGSPGKDGRPTVIRTEERLSVGTERVEAGRVHLRKHVETEKQQVTEGRTISDEIHKDRFDIVDDRESGGKPER